MVLNRLYLEVDCIDIAYIDDDDDKCRSYNIVLHFSFNGDEYIIDNATCVSSIIHYPYSFMVYKVLMSQS